MYIDANLNDSELTPASGEGGFETLPEGDYEFRVASITDDVSSKGTRMLVIDFELVCNADGTDSPNAGKTQRGWYVYETDFGRRRLLQLLNAAGVKADKKGGFDDAKLLGSSLIATIVHKERKVPGDDGEVKIFVNANLIKERNLDDFEEVEEETPAPVKNSKGGRGRKAQPQPRA